MVAAILAAVAGLVAGAVSLDQDLVSLIETPNLSSPAISPDGRYVAFRRDVATVSDNRHRFSWWVAPIDGRLPAVEVADGGDAMYNEAGALISAPPTWSADSRFIYYRTLTRDGVQVARAGLGRSVAPVTASSADVLDFVLKAGGEVVFATGPARQDIIDAEAKERERGVLVDHTVDPAQNLFGAIKVNGRLSAQRFTGRWFGRRTLLGEQPPRYWRTSGETSEIPIGIDEARAAGLVIDTALRPLFGTSGPSDRNAAGDRVFLDADHGVRIKRAGGLEHQCGAKMCGVDSVVQLSWRPGRDQILLIARTSLGGRVVRLWDPIRGSARILYTTEDQLSGGGSGNAPCAVGERATVCILASAISPPRLISIDLESGHAKDLTPSSTDPGVTARRVRWTDKSGRSFYGHLIEPSGVPQRRPLFITYYTCGGYLRGGTGDEWPLEVFARAGIAALCIEKLSEGSSSQDANLHAYEAASAGIEAVIDRLSADGVVDPQRVGIGGLSFGSDVAMWTAIRTNRIAAVSIASVQLEPTYWWFNTVRGRNVADAIRQAWGLGAPDETPERWRLLSPALNVEKIRAPVLMQMPEQEFRPTMELYSRLSQTSTPTELYVFPMEPHILTEPKHRLAAYERNLDWFRFWLQGAEDADPRKAAQYQRWRASRERWKADRR